VITTDGGLALRPGALDRGGVFRALEAQVEAALREGYKALRLVCEATRFLGRNTRFDELLEFEERLERVFRDRPLLGLWQYDPWRCSAGVLRHLLRMHPFVVIRGEVCRNCLFVPPGRADGGTGQDDWQAALTAIVERARSEEAAARRLEQLRLALDAGGHALWEWDLERETVRLEPQPQGPPGKEPLRSVAKLSEWEQGVHPEGLAPFWKSARDHIEGRSPRLEHELRVRDRAGGWRWVQLRARSVERDPSGRPLRISGTASDVNELRAARERLLARDHIELSGRLASGVAREIDGRLAKVGADLGFVKELLQRLPAADVPAAGAVARAVEVLEEAQRNAHGVREVAADMAGALGSSASGDPVPCDAREELLRAVPEGAPAHDEVRLTTAEKPPDPERVRAAVDGVAPQ
jgi:PAS domain-containing protein